MRRIAWTRDKPNTLLIEDDDGSTEVTLQGRTAISDADAALEAHRAALQGRTAISDADAALEAHRAALQGRATGDASVVVRERGRQSRT